MSDTDNDKPKLGMRTPLGLKRTVETGKVKQSFSHGRQNTVVVEVKRRRILGKPGEAEAALVLDLSPVGDLAEAATNLFGYMKKADAVGARSIAFSPIPATGPGEAINDRLRRAAAPRE